MRQSLKAYSPATRRNLGQLIPISSAIFSIIAASFFTPVLAQSTKIEETHKTAAVQATDLNTQINEFKIKDDGILTIKPYKPVVAVLDLMDQFDVDRKYEDSLARLRKDKQALPYLSRLYIDLSRNAGQRSENKETNTGYTRWKTVYLMGLIDDPKAIKHLSKIAQSSLPDAELAGDVAYANEYRVRLRAIASLERLKAVEPLRRLHKAGGPLSRSAAVSLFELGEKVNGIKKIDGQKVVGLGDSKNYNVKEQDKLEVKGSPSSDRHKEQKIVPETKSGKQDKQSTGA